MNVIARLDFELAYFEIAVHHFNHYAKWTPPFSLFSNTDQTWRQLHKDAMNNIEEIQEAAPHKAAAVRTPTTYHENYPS